jgi:hypothetical protein
MDARRGEARRNEDKECFVTFLPLAAISLAVVSFLIGGSCLFLVRCQCNVKAKVGRRLFIAALLALGVVGLVAASERHEGLAPLGLLVGLLVVAMLCEFPATELDS